MELQQPQQAARALYCSSFDGVDSVQADDRARGQLHQANFSCCFFKDQFLLQSFAINKGSYGKVEVVLSQQDSKYYAIKLTRVSDRYGRLDCTDSMRLATFQNEIKAYHKLNAGVENGTAQNAGIPQVVAHGVTRLEEDSCQCSAFVIMQLLGDDLSSACTTGLGFQRLYPQGYEGFMEPSSFISLAKQMLTSLRYLHEHGLVHKDVKPDNFCVANDQAPGQLSKIFLIDYGFARPIPRDDEEHKDSGFLGTPCFASRRVFAGLCATRRCDLESLAYCLMELYRGETCWYIEVPPASQEDDDDPGWSDKQLQAMLKQRDYEYERMRSRGQMPCFIEDWLQYLSTLGWNDKPCYEKLESIIESVVWQRAAKRRRSGEEEFEQQSEPLRCKRMDSCTLCDDSTMLQLNEE